MSSADVQNRLGAAQGRRGAPLLTVSDVGHTYGSGPSAHLAVQRLAFDVYDGEFVSIVGPSGAGKSTMLRILSGLIRPTEGTITLGGKEVTGVPEGMAMVFQDYSRSLLPWLSVTKNVAFPLTRRGGVVSKAERRTRVDDALAAVGLAGHGSRYPWQLSGGMQQRVAIARAIAYQPTLLLMDEPFASVDAQTRADLEDLVLRIKKQFNVTILFVTHDIDESVYLADRILVLSRSPASIVDDIAVNLPEARDQISTREEPEFVHLRAQVARLIRGDDPASD